MPETSDSGDYSESEYPDADGYAGESEYPDDCGDGYLPWDEPPDMQGIHCADCGKAIIETTSRNGRKWTPETIRRYSESRFRRCLCTNCQTRAKGGQCR